MDEILAINNVWKNLQKAMFLMFQENGFKLLDFTHMEELSSLLLYICIRTEQSQHQIFGIRTEQNET